MDSFSSGLSHNTTIENPKLSMFCDNTRQYHSLWRWNGIAFQHQKDNSYRKYNETTSHKIAENLPKKIDI